MRCGRTLPNLNPHLLLKNNLLHTGAGEALLAHAGAREEAAVHDVTGEGQGGVVHDRAAEIVDGLLVHARACEEAAVHDGAEEDAEAVLVHIGAGEEVAEAVLVHVRAGDEVAEALLVHVRAGDEAAVHNGASEIAEAG